MISIKLPENIAFEIFNNNLLFNENPVASNIKIEYKEKNNNCKISFNGFKDQKEVPICIAFRYYKKGANITVIGMELIRKINFNFDINIGILGSFKLNIEGTFNNKKFKTVVKDLLELFKFIQAKIMTLV